jgi:sugar phosphate isomerase/epimerase
VWYVEQSILFWKEFLKDDPGVQIVLENVLEETPDMLLDVVKGVDDPRLRLCLDIGHANAYSQVPVMDWLKMWAPYISHFHIHNNDGSEDQHHALAEGSIPVKDLLIRSEQLCPDATYTLELMKDTPSVPWLKENELL